MKVLVIDNYDSFTYNLVHYLEDLNCDVTVKRNDKLNLEEIKPKIVEKIDASVAKTSVAKALSQTIETQKLLQTFVKHTT